MRGQAPQIFFPRTATDPNPNPITVTLTDHTKSIMTLTFGPATLRTNELSPFYDV